MKKLTVLYLDDEEMNLVLFNSFFKNAYDLHVFESPLKALDFLKSGQQVDVIISDMKMPEMNGVQFITKVREEVGKIRSYILTGYGYDEHIENAVNQGMIVKCLHKPFERTEILEELT